MRFGLFEACQSFLIVPQTHTLHALAHCTLYSKAYCQMPNDGASLPDDRALVFTILRLPACSVAPTVDSFSSTLCSIASDRKFSGGAIFRTSVLLHWLPPVISHEFVYQLMRQKLRIMEHGFEFGKYALWWTTFEAAS